MTTRSIRLLLLTIGVWQLSALDTVRAAQYEKSVMMTGLVGPRGLALGPDGGLYVTESGSGGPDVGFEVLRDGVLGNVFHGPSGAVSRLLDGVQERILNGLPSVAQENGTQATSLQNIAFNSAGELFGVMGIGGTPAHRAEIGVAGESFGQLVRVPLNGNGVLEPLADLITYEATANPDGGEINSNPFELMMELCTCRT